MNHKKIAVITNFGCKTNCKYCIWKNHNLYDKYKNYDLKLSTEKQIESLNNIFNNGYNINRFVISGGGDPLNNPRDQYISTFYKKIFSLCKQYDKIIDISTSYSYRNIMQFISDFYIVKDYINYILLHRNINNTNLIDIKKIYKIHNKIRIMYVITNDIDIKFLKFIERYISDNLINVQLTYKKYIGDLYSPDPEVLTFAQNVHNRIKNGKFIYDENYHQCILPDGSIYINESME